MHGDRNFDEVKRRFKKLPVEKIWDFFKSPGAISLGAPASDIALLKKIENTLPPRSLAPKLALYGVDFNADTETSFRAGFFRLTLTKTRRYRKLASKSRQKFKKK